MTTWHLTGVGHAHRIEIPLGQVITVGRAPDTDALIGDVTVSRRHAELEGLSHGLRVRDLGSSNGTSVNGARIGEADAIAGDTVTFGKVVFRLSGEAAETGESAMPPAVIRSVALAAPASEAPTVRDHAVRLDRVLELARRLSGELELDKLIAAIVELTFELLPVDRVALLLGNDDGELVPTLTRSRIGEGAGMRVPRSIAQRAVTDRAPIVTENAVADERFKSGSVMLQAVRGAICTPLLGAGERVLGVLYVDTLTAKAPFSDDDATLLFAFGGLAAVTIGNVRLAEEVRRENEVRANFERFFAPNVAARIAREQGVIGLGGERREATILFSDVRGFTPIAERMRPEDLAHHLTDYFTEMTDLVFEHGGTLDKFIGDALLAVWGAPISAADDADRALRAAREMQERLGALNRHWHSAGRPPLEIGIGLSAGEVFAGYLGSARRLEYSVMGDPVNVASRLCDDAGPGEILLDQAILDRISSTPEVERAAEIALRGKTKPVIVYRLRR